MFTNFKEADFDVFKIDGLETRMDALIKHIRPKLEYLGQYYAPALSVLTGDEMFAHVAKHARRSVNPPNDTWVAFSSNKRGYKMLPHFQIGLWETHLFVWFAIIYEAPNKENFGKTFEANIQKICRDIRANFVWSIDHTKPGATLHSDLVDHDLLQMFKRLQTVKKAELLCGYHLSRDEVISLSADEMLKKIESVFNELVPLYKMLQG